MERLRKENIGFYEAYDLAREGYLVYRKVWGDGVLMFSKDGYTINKEDFINDNTIPDSLKSILTFKNEINHTISFYLYVEGLNMLWPLGINAGGLGKGDREATDWIAF